MKSPIEPHTLSRITTLRILGLSYPRIAEQMKQEKWPTVNGGDWYPNTIRQYCQLASRQLKASTVEAGPMSKRNNPNIAYSQEGGGVRIARLKVA